jgi:enterochelin esterase family protein
VALALRFCAKASTLLFDGRLRLNLAAMRSPLLALLTFALLAPRLHAQAPTSPRPKPVVSPEIGADRQVTFRLKAAQAQSVELRGQWTKDKLVLAKGEEGVWSLTTGPVEPGVWEYSLVVDGLTMIDPANPAMKPQRAPSASILQIPGTPPNVWDFQDVPHGAVHQHTYLSKALGRPRECSIYTPPSYETDVTKRYPLLVLQHGSGDNQQTWVTHGKAHWILDNLIAQGLARPMVVLMIDGHPLGTSPREGGMDRTAAMEAFRNELFEDALPLTEARYRVEKDAAHRAIAGLSMGGGHALSIGLANLDRFSAIGAFSAAPPEESFVAPALSDSAGTNQRLKLLWIAVGKDDFLREKCEQFIARLKAAGINHEWHLTEGAHAWPVWRGYLAEFAPKLFPDSPK